MAAGLKAVGSTATGTAPKGGHQAKDVRMVTAREDTDAAVKEEVSAATESHTATAKDVRLETARETMDAAVKEEATTTTGSHTETARDIRMVTAKEATDAATKVEVSTAREEMAVMTGSHSATRTSAQRRAFTRRISTISVMRTKAE